MFVKAANFTNMEQTHIHIYKIGGEAVKQLREISIATFHETFSDSNTAENMDQYILDYLSEERLTAELSNPESEFYFVKNEAGELMAYLKLNRGAAQTEPQPDTYLEVERIYVLEQYQGLKIGKQLMEFAFQRAEEINSEAVWLGVWEHNTKAISFYTRIGFTQFGSHVFQLGDDAQTDILMKKILT
jgi:diamine N-acetyltransferase